jgi:hypothetical protein
VIAIVIFVAGLMVSGSRLREVKMLSGSVRMLGFADGIGGMIDVLRKRQD